MDYKEFLSFADIISEEDYNKVLSILPNIEYDEFDLDCPYDLNSKGEIAEMFIKAMLCNWNTCYIESLDLETKTICLCDIESLEDLEEIKNKLDPWVISNYEDLKSDLLEELEEELQKKVDNKKASLVAQLCKVVSIEELETLVKEYGKKRTSK